MGFDAKGCDAKKRGMRTKKKVYCGNARIAILLGRIYSIYYWPQNALIFVRAPMLRGLGISSQSWQWGSFEPTRSIGLLLSPERRLSPPFRDPYKQQSMQSQRGVVPTQPSGHFIRGLIGGADYLPK